MCRHVYDEEYYGRILQRLDCPATSNAVGDRHYAASRLFPREELYGPTNQLRRAAVSVPSNMAEGQARFSRKEFHHFLSLARGSIVEIETQLIIATNLGYLSTSQSRELLVKAGELGRIVNGLLHRSSERLKLSRSISNSPF